jgi:hypothetical protein
MCDSIRRPVVSLRNIVQILRLVRFNLQSIACIDAGNGRRIRTAFVDGDLFRQTVQFDGAL